MRLSSPFIQVSVAAVIFLAAVVACGIWYNALASESARVAGIQGRIEDAQQTAKRIAAARAALSQIAGDEASVRAYFVSDANIVNFIDDLQTRGQTLGADVTVLSVSAANAGTHPALDLSVSVKGPFDAVMRTIGAIEYAPYDVVMGAVSVNQQPQNGWLASVSFVVGSAPASLGGSPLSTATSSLRAIVSSTTPLSASSTSGTSVTPAAPAPAQAQQQRRTPTPTP